MSQARAPYRIEYRDALTQRQQEVLALLARGRTNAQIGEDLGIGYETVKTHVAEILGKLGVQSREEAAALYQEQRGLGHRLKRTGHRLAALVATRAALLTVGAVTLIAAVALAGVFLFMEDETEPPASATEVPGSATAEPTESPGDTATPAPTTVAATPTAVPFPSEVAGRPVTELVAGPPVEFPEDLVLYVATSTCDACGWPPGDIWRIYRSSGGGLVADHVEPGLEWAGHVYDYWQSVDGHLALAALCTSGACGLEADPNDETTVQLLRSTDGGITWDALEHDPLQRARVQFAGSYAGEALTYASHYDSNGQVESMDVFLAPSMTPVDYPDDLPDPTSPDRHPAIPFPAATGDLFWLLYLNGRTQLFDQQGQSVAASPSLGSLLPGAWWLGSSQVGADVQVWQSDAAGSPNSSRTLYVEVDDTGRPLAGFTTDLRSLRFRARLDETRWLGSAQIPPAPGEPDRGENYRAVLIDTVSGTVHPILGLPRDASPLPGNFSWPRLAVTGDFVRVATGDADCLNVREEATTAATSLGCFADGVLLRVRDAEPVAGWVPATTPGGAAGFVAEAFVER